MCDVYVYEDVRGGWTTHVASRRRIFPPIPDMPLMIFPRFGGKWSQESRRMVYPSRWHAIAAHVVFGFAAFWHNNIHMAMLRLIPLRPIGLPQDGASFNDETPALCAVRLTWLRAMGYRVPQYAINALLDEAQEPNADAADQERSQEQGAE